MKKIGSGKPFRIEISAANYTSRGSRGTQVFHPNIEGSVPHFG
jgi:hypothetical protein